MLLVYVHTIYRHILPGAKYNIIHVRWLSAPIYSYTSILYSLKYNLNLNIDVLLPYCIMYIVLVGFIYTIICTWHAIYNAFIMHVYILTIRAEIIWPSYNICIYHVYAI